ncbi:aldo/keto reductase [Pedobacter sp. BMA]|uniref:aldo/keto reductase n=1 Tax=Pedobacter sp. BMA TaxID=1663685 RepID=UPI00064A5777|nr:aldo/keto reductase [Pedobacter sp. BMA]KLT66747.1 aldehyde oxidase [Pedobacter sp. BMA]
MKTRKIGKLEVSAVGYGCMGLSHGYGNTTEKSDALRIIHQAYDLGCTFFDTAEVYGKGHNEEVVGEGLQGFRDNIVLASKFNIPKNDSYTPNSLLKEIRSHLEASLKRLRTDRIELYYQHRVIKGIPVEDVAWCMGELIKEGKILGWGQSQSTEQEIRRAHAVTPLSAVQSEYSLMERMFETDVIPACQELGIGFVPFSPLASGFLSGKGQTGNSYSGDDVRRVITRFDEENVAANQPLLDLLNNIAQQKQVTPAQISLAWMLKKKDFIVPIPGGRTLERMQENFGAADIDFSDEEFIAFEFALSGIQIHGNRTDEDVAKLKSLEVANT